LNESPLGMKPQLGCLILALAAAFAARGAVVAQSNLVYGQADGTPLRLDACVPDGAGPFPAVIMVHGGSWTGGDKRRDVSVLCAPLTSAKLVWFSINYRLAPQSRYPACLNDVESAILWVKAHAGDYKVDPRRIALLGESAGAQLVEMAAVQATPATRVAAVVPFYGPCDLMAEYHDRGLTRAMVALFGHPQLDPAMADLMRGASPVNFVHAGLPPFLLIHGTGDRIVSYQQSVRFQEKLRADGVACDLITIPGGLHGMGNWEKSAPAYKNQVVDWLVRTLGSQRTELTGLVPATLARHLN
jgi:acetyl esterase/lipase